MRRIASIAVLAVLMTPLLAPLAQGSPSSLPPCCRTGGKHHCEMSAATSGLDGFKSPTQSCSYRMHAAVVSQLAALTAARNRVVSLAINGEAARPIEVSLGSNDSSDAHKRGPPTA
jgi:hypothetical protein